MKNNAETYATATDIDIDIDIDTDAQIRAELLASDDDARMTAARKVAAALSRLDKSADNIQSAMMEILRPMAERESWDKQRIESDPAILHVLKNAGGSPSRARLVDWLQAFTPLRVQLERRDDGTPTGAIKGIKLRTGPKAPAWNLDDAEQTPFLSSSKATAIAGPADPSIEKAMDNLAKQAARLLDTDSLATIRTIRAAIDAKLATLAADIGEQQAKLSHQAWVERHQSSKADAVRAAA